MSEYRIHSGPFFRHRLS